MAVITKTIWYPLATDTASVAASTQRTFTALNIDIPETTSRAFKSVILWIYGMDNAAAATSVGTATIGFTLSGATRGTATQNGYTNSGEHQDFQWMVDCASHFTSDYGAATTSKSFTVDISVASIATINVGGWIIITYECDDSTENTRAKTVFIPIEGANAALTTSLAEIGSQTNQVPNLDTFLPESTKTYKQVAFWVMSNEFTTADSGTNPTQGLALDSESSVEDGAHDDTLVSARGYHRIWVRNDMTTNATHAFKAKTLNTQMPFTNLCAVLVVTYTYSLSGSSTIINSLLMPMIPASHVITADDSTDKEVFRLKFFIEEPATVTARQSGILCSHSMNNTAAVTYNYKAGSQAAVRTYTPTAASSGQGNVYELHRIDYDSGMSLARGENTITFEVYRGVSGVSDSGVWSALAIINYTSAKATAGAEHHNKTVVWLGSTFHGFSSPAMAFEQAAASPVNFTESSWWVTNFGVWFQGTQVSTNVGRGCMRIDWERLSGEDLPTDGWENMATFAVSSGPNAECAWHNYFMNLTEKVMRHATYPAQSEDYRQLNPESSRKIRTICADGNLTSNGYMHLWLLTYHSITFSASGVSTGHTGSGNPVNVYRADNKEFLYSTTTDSGGNFTVTGYDNVLDLFIECRINDNLVARSGNFKLT